MGWNSSKEWKCSIESWTANATAGFGPTIGDSDDAYVGWWQHADPRIWISTTTPTGILLWSSSDYVRSNGDDSSSYARRDGSNSVKNVGDLCRWFVIYRKIRERKSLGSFRLDFKLASWKESVFCKGLQMQKWIAFQFCLEGSCAFSFRVFEIHVRFEHTCDWLIAFWEKLWTVGFSWRIFQTRGSHLQLKSCIMLGIRPAITFLEGQRRDASLRLLKFSGFDLSSGQWYPYLGVNCMLDRLLLVVMICATWLWFHQSNCIVLKWEISWEKSKTPSIVDMGSICIILICQWNKLMGTPCIEDTISWTLFSHLCRQIGDRISHLDTRFAILWWPMSRILKHWCCKRKYTSPYESSGLQSWFGLWKRDEKGVLHRQTWFNLLFTWEMWDDSPCFI